MKIFFVSLLFIVYRVDAQHPYRDSLEAVYRIDERLITTKTDTTVSLRSYQNDKDTITFERITICRDSNNKIIRIDKIFLDSSRFAFAYFSNHTFHLMQWNEPAERSVYESKIPIVFSRHPNIRMFYLALLTVPDIEMPIITKYSH